MPMAAKSSSEPKPIGERLRTQRVEVLGKGLREMAKLLEIAPAHLTDIEKGRRSPSDELLVRIAAHYEIDEPDLRTAWAKAERVVNEVATQDSTTARKVPEFLRTARDLSPEQWDKLIKQAEKMGGDKPKRPGK
jgi:transcriptional regulator with XRE-family HTH domain